MKKNTSSKCIAIFILGLTCFFSTINSNATDFYVDPIHGSMTGNGSKANPWSTMQEVWEQGKIETNEWYPRPYVEGVSKLVAKNIGAPVKAADTIYLLDGYHGILNIQGALNTKAVTIKAADGATPRLSRIFLRSASNWIFEGLSISPSYTTPFSKGDIFKVESHHYRGPSSNITLRNSTVFSVPSVANYNKLDWLNNTFKGIVSLHTNNTIVDSVHVFHVDHAITLSGSTHSKIINCDISDMRGDGIRFPGSHYTVIEGNHVKNNRQVNANHPDLIQSWALDDGPLHDIIIRKNILIGRDRDIPFAANPQGIGMFDGEYRNFLIENNLVIVNHYHGISLYGAHNCIIQNNTVVTKWNTPAPLKANIKVYPHKNGTPGSNNIVRNNFSSAVHTKSAKGVGGVVINESNITVTISNNTDYFISPNTFDFRLKPNTIAINGGSKTGGALDDLTGRIRTDLPDVGAYEYVRLK